jgi:hypothetical protein
VADYITPGFNQGKKSAGLFRIDLREKEKRLKIKGFPPWRATAERAPVTKPSIRRGAPKVKKKPRTTGAFKNLSNKQ